MTIEVEVDRVLTIARLGWLVTSIAAAPFTWWMTQSWAWLVFFPALAFALYHLALWLAHRYLMATLPMDQMFQEGRDEALAAFEELTSGLQEGTLEADSERAMELIAAAGLEVAVVTRTSEEKVGRFQDQEIFEWIEMLDPSTRKTERYTYDRVAERDAGGNPIVTTVEGRTQALYNGCVYSRADAPST
jgi:hypothetical protein